MRPARRRPGAAPAEPAPPIRTAGVTSAAPPGRVVGTPEGARTDAAPGSDPGEPATSPAPDAAAAAMARHDPSLRAVLRIPAFRQLWVALSFSSLGDWLGLLATTAMAASLTGTGAAGGAAVSGVLILRLLPAVVLGPVAGALADRLDRRRTMVVADLLRFGLFVSIPVVGTLWWLLVATFLIECVALFWIPAKEAAVPNLVPRSRLEAANQLSLVTAYGSAPVAALVFSVLSVVNGWVSAAIPGVAWTGVELALYADAATFLFSAATVFRINGAAFHRDGVPERPEHGPSVLRSILDGWGYVAGNRVVRGLVIGIGGAFISGGFVIGVAQEYVAALDGGRAGYGLLFGAVFIGLALGMLVGPRMLGRLSRRRLFGLSLAVAGFALVLVAISGELFLAWVATLLLGAGAGVTWITGYTLLGLETPDEVRGRTFAFVQSLVRVLLILVIALAAPLAGALASVDVPVGPFVITLSGARLTLVLAAVVALVVGIVSYRLVDDHGEVGLVQDLRAAVGGHPEERPRHPGLFVALEGGDGTGKSTQVGLLAAHLREQGMTVVTTREPGGSPLGARVRSLVLDPATGALDPRTEALLYAADRAEHVSKVVLPALTRGDAVITDRYVDSSLAYQGAGRTIGVEEVARVNRWGTGGLVPDLTVVLDLPADQARARLTGTPDRLEAEPSAFHEAVRQAFLDLAAREPARYVVLRADQAPENVATAVAAAVDALLAARAADQASTPEHAAGGGAS